MKAKIEVEIEILNVDNFNKEELAVDIYTAIVHGLDVDFGNPNNHFKILIKNIEILEK